MSKVDLILMLGSVLVPMSALGCGKTDVRFTANGRLVVTLAWDDPTPANGFHAVARKLPRCPSQGYQMQAASTAGARGADEAAGAEP